MFQAGSPLISRLGCSLLSIGLKNGSGTCFILILEKTGSNSKLNSQSCLMFIYL
jgi:hypothetical protein